MFWPKLTCVVWAAICLIANCLQAFALTPTAPENCVWEIFSIWYDAPTAEATDLGNRTETSTSNYDTAPTYRATNEEIPTEANRTLFGRNAEFKAAEESEEAVTIYCGVHAEHPDLPAAYEGKANPWGGHSNPALHNDNNNASVFTSWTTNPDIATQFATDYGPGGVVLRMTVPRSRLVTSPDIYRESEVLIEGPVSGATPIIISK